MALKSSQHYRDIAEKIITKYPVAFGHIDIDKVVFLVEDEKKPKKYADCRLVKWPATYFTDQKYMIIFYEQIINGMTEAQENMLVFHELLHIHPDFEHIRKHDVEDFAELVSLYGVNWAIDPNLTDILEDDTTAPTPAANPIVQEDDEPEM